MAHGQFCRHDRWRPSDSRDNLAPHGINRHDVLDVLRRRWPDVVVKGLEHEEPTWTMTPDDAAFSAHAAGEWNRCEFWSCHSGSRAVTVAAAPAMVEPMCGDMMVVQWQAARTFGLVGVPTQ